MKKLIAMLLVCLMMVCTMATAFATEGEIPSGVAGEPTTTQPVVETGKKNETPATSSEPIPDPKNDATPNNKKTGTGFLDNVQTPEELLDIREVSVDEIRDKIDEKGMDVIHIMQKVCQYICIGAFIIGAIMFVIGLIANKKLMTGGILCLVFSGLAYAAITCGPTIVKLIAGWAAS